MQLDRTNVVIRARSLSEIGDLAMILIRCYPAASILGFAIGLMPWAILNAVLVGWIPLAQFAEGIYDEEMDEQLVRYLFLMITLVILQTPLAGVITTNLIGRSVFEQRVTWQSVFADLRQTFGRLLWVLGVLRGPVPLMLVLATNWGQPLAVGREIWIPIAFLILVGFQRSRRPFMPEILLLERCPLRAQSPAAINVRRRNAALHNPLASELIGRFLTVSMMLGVLFFAVLYALLWVRGVMLGRWDWSLTVYLVFIPAALWTVAGLSVLIRFLSYLDTRIRLEGWEVDLAIRAETLRQFGELPLRPVTGGEHTTGPAMTTLASSLIAVMLLQLSPAVIAAPPRASDPVAAAAGVQGPSVAGWRTDQVTVSRVPSSTWYDAEAQQLRPLPVQSNHPDSANRQSRWLPRAEKVKTTPPAAGGTGGGMAAKHVFGWMLLAMLALLLIGVMLYIFSKLDPDAVGSSATTAPAGRRGLDQQTLERMEHLPAEVRRSDVDLRDEAERLMKLGRLDEAIVLLYGHQLLLLDGGGLLRLARGKTNGRYLRETQRNDPAAHSLLAATVTAFEASYFGQHVPPSDRFEQLWADNAQLEALVAAKLEAAA